MIAFTILGEPASKSNSRKLVTFGRGDKSRPALIKSQKARDYERDAQRQIPDDARQMLDGPVRVTMRIFYASERPDLDEAVILDVMQAKYERAKGKRRKVANGEYAEEVGERVMVRRGVYRNDRQVREKHVFHFIDRNNPRAEIEVEAMAPQQTAIFIDNTHARLAGSGGGESAGNPF